RVTDEDVAGLRSLLEASGDVDGITRRESPTLVRHDFAGVDSHAHLQLGPELSAQLAVEPGELLTKLGSCTRAAERIVLVHDRDAEDRHDGVADELLHGSPVTFQHAAGDGEVPLHHTPEGLRV